jgi:hypothetical protein
MTGDSYPLLEKSWRRFVEGWMVLRSEACLRRCRPLFAADGFAVYNSPDAYMLLDYKMSSEERRDITVVDNRGYMFIGRGYADEWIHSVMMMMEAKAIIYSRIPQQLRRAVYHLNFNKAWSVSGDKKSRSFEFLSNLNFYISIVDVLELENMDLRAPDNMYLALRAPKVRVVIVVLYIYFYHGGGGCDFFEWLRCIWLDGSCQKNDLMGGVSETFLRRGLRDGIDAVSKVRDPVVAHQYPDVQYLYSAKYKPLEDAGGWLCRLTETMWQMDWSRPCENTAVYVPVLEVSGRYKDHQRMAQKYAGVLRPTTITQMFHREGRWMVVVVPFACGILSLLTCNIARSRYEDMVFTWDEIIILVSEKSYRCHWRGIIETRGIRVNEHASVKTLQRQMCLMDYRVVEWVSAMVLRKNVPALPELGYSVYPNPCMCRCSCISICRCITHKAEHNKLIDKKTRTEYPSPDCPHAACMQVCLCLTDNIPLAMRGDLPSSVGDDASLTERYMSEMAFDQYGSNLGHQLLGNLVFEDV